MKILVLLIIIIFIVSCSPTATLPPVNSDPANAQVNTKVEVKPALINGKTADQRIEEAYQLLHRPESGAHIRENFPDIRKIYSDPGEAGFPTEILPFEYYYSPAANKTFNIGALDFTVFICNGELARKITAADENSGRCTVAAIYRATRESPDS